MMPASQARRRAWLAVMRVPVSREAAQAAEEGGQVHGHHHGRRHAAGGGQLVGGIALDVFHERLPHLLGHRPRGRLVR